MPLGPKEVAELSRLLDDALALEDRQREVWLAKLQQAKPEIAARLRAMLHQFDALSTESLPRLPIEDEAVAAAGERVGPYILVREIGRGGMGSVWLADRADGAFKRRLALKLPRLTWSAGLAKRMARERDIGALLEHPNIARLYDAGIDQHGRPYIAYEYIQGKPLNVYCNVGELDLPSRLKLFLRVVQAVAFAHSRLVLHRDIKPGNVLVDANGNVHLLDFGIAKLLDETVSELTQEQGRLLTLNYAAPEQILGQPLGVASDIYSLGVVLFELMTGTLPYRLKRNTPAAIEEAICNGDVALASSQVVDRHMARELRGDLEAIVGKAIKREPNERYLTADALAGDIQRFLDEQPITARADSFWYRLRKSVARHRLPVAAGTAVAIATLIGTFGTYMQGQRADQEAERTRLATSFVADMFRSSALRETATGDSARTDIEQLDRTAELIDVRFRGQPTLQAELYGAVGRVYVDLGVDRKAMLYAKRQLDALRSQRASEHLIGRSLMLVSEAALAAAHYDVATARAQEALALVRASDAIVPDILAVLARAQTKSGKFEAAQRTVSDGWRVLQQQGRSKSMASAWLLFVQGALLARQNKLDSAMPMLEAAFLQATEIEGPESRAAAEMRLWVAGVLIQNGRSNEAGSLYTVALSALESAGGTGALLAAKWRVDIASGRFAVGDIGYEEALAELDEAARLLNSRRLVVPAELTASVNFALARIHHERGEYSKAKPLFDSSSAVLRRSTENYQTLYLLAGFSGECAMYVGAHEEADGLLRNALELQTKLFPADHPYASYDWAAIAMNFNMQGRYQEALTFLAKAPAFEKIEGAPGDHSLLLPATLSRILLESGDVNGALNAFPTTEVSPSHEDSGPPNPYYQLRGELRCASGDFSGGLIDLLRSIKTQERGRGGPNSPWLARTRSVAGLCALMHGERSKAAELADLSSRSLFLQTNVSPYFKQPLEQLEQQLQKNSKPALPTARPRRVGSARA